MKQTKTSIAKQLLDYGSGKNVCLPSEEVSKSFKDAMKVVFNQRVVLSQLTSWQIAKFKI